MEPLGGVFERMLFISTSLPADVVVSLVLLVGVVPALADPGPRLWAAGKELDAIYTDGALYVLPSCWRSGRKERML